MTERKKKKVTIQLHQIESFTTALSSIAAREIVEERPRKEGDEHVRDDDTKVDGSSKRNCSRTSPLLHRQRDEAVVLGDVALQDVSTRAKNTLESSSIQLDALQRSLGYDRGCARTVKEESNFTKVI